jgi:hypothetical protein
MRSTYVIRVWLPDRPGALGAVASRVGAVGGDVVGIDILERGAGRAIDELAVELPDPGLVELLIHEMHQVDGVDVEDIRPVGEALHDPRLDALETAALLVGASSDAEMLQALCTHACRTVGAAWAAIVSVEEDRVVAAQGEAPDAPWLLAYLSGSQMAARLAQGGDGPADVIWSPLPAAGLALVLGRKGQDFRARERRQGAALARIVDTRFREVNRETSRRLHPAQSRSQPRALSIALDH